MFRETEGNVLACNVTIHLVLGGTHAGAGRGKCHVT